jgi:hypothetical protein
MNYTVQQLLKARQDGVPDYIIVPELQRAIALQQAAKKQQAMQQNASPPPVGHQILNRAMQQMQPEQMQPEMAGGGIVALAEGGGLGSVLTDIQDYLPTQEDMSEQYQIDKMRNLMGGGENYDEVAKAIADKEKGLSEDSPLTDALIRGGIGLISSRAPNFQLALGDALKEGFDQYTQSSSGHDKGIQELNQLKLSLANARRQEQSAIAKYGIDSAQAQQASRNRVIAEALTLKRDQERNEIYRQRAEDLAKHYGAMEKAASTNASANIIRANAASNNANGKGDGLTVSQTANALNRQVGLAQKALKDANLDVTTPPDKLKQLSDAVEDAKTRYSNYVTTHGKNIPPSNGQKTETRGEEYLIGGDPSKKVTIHN